MPDPPEDNEPIDRAIFSSKHISKKNNTVKSDAFIPHKERLDISVYRVDGLSRKSVWQLVANYVEQKRRDGKKAKAIAEIRIADVRKHKMLKFNPNGIPHPRYLNIEKFPSSKSEAKMIAVEMANEAKLFIKE